MDVLFQTILASGDGFSEAISWLEDLSGYSKEGGLLVAEIIKNLCFAAACILALVMFFADRRGHDLGFNGGRFLLILGAVSGAIYIAQKAFGLS